MRDEKENSEELIEVRLPSLLSREAAIVELRCVFILFPWQIICKDQTIWEANASLEASYSFKHAIR